MSGDDNKKLATFSSEECKNFEEEKECVKRLAALQVKGMCRDSYSLTDSAKFCYYDVMLGW